MSNYTGPVCYVGHDHTSADGRELAGGWHYTVVEGPDGTAMPGEPLFLNDKTGKYRLATGSDKSHHERHHKRLTLIAVDGGLGDPQTPEEVEAAHRHLDELERRIADDGLDPHERDHLIRTPDQIRVVRGWLPPREEQT